jgi:HK97 gp10 family phage protein
VPVVFKSRFDEIRRELPDRVDGAVKAAAGLIADGALERVPVDTGDLQRAIHVERQAEREYLVVAGDRSAFYGHMVEFGTSHSAPRPFLIPAFEAAREQVEAMVATSLKAL